MKIFIGADHRGFALKEEVKKWLAETGVETEDVGALTLDPTDDYPVFAAKVGKAVVASQNSLGIVFCGGGVGVDIVANKIDGVRSGFALNSDQVKAARRDDDINILAIPSDYTDLDKAKEFINAFINTSFATEEKYKRRIEEIKKIEDET